MPGSGPRLSAGSPARPVTAVTAQGCGPCREQGTDPTGSGLYSYRACTRRDGEELPEQGFDTDADLADLADAFDGLPPGGAGQVPVFVALAGEDRAGVPAAHGDHHIGIRAASPSGAPGARR